MKLNSSIKAILIATASIILLFVIGDRFNFRTDVDEAREFVLELDTAAIVEIHSTAVGDGHNDLHLFRVGPSWAEGSPGNVQVDAGRKAKDLFAVFGKLRVKREMGSLLEFGDRFDLRTNTARTVSFLDLNGVVHSLNIGTSTFGTGKDDVWTYVHVPLGTKVYAVQADLQGLIRAGK